MSLPSVKTHKIIIATYEREVLYCVPNDWEVEDIQIRDEVLYLEGGEQNVPKFEIDCDRIPDKIEHADWDPYDEIDVWFDCEERDALISCKDCGAKEYGWNLYDCDGVPPEEDYCLCVPCAVKRGIADEEDK